MAIKGSLKEASLADVCQLLAMGQKTGCLSVTDRSNFGQIFFDRGRITYARIVNRRDRLGDLLIGEGVLGHEQLREAIDRQSREPERRLGELMVEEGMLSTEQLEHYIRLQIEEAVYYLFTWSRGSFYFEVDQQPDETDMLVSINPESLLLEGARRVDEWSLIEKKIPSLDLLFEVDGERVTASGVELTSDQERLLPLLDGSHTVQELAEQTGLVEFDVGKALYGLLQAGFAHRVGQRTATEAARVRDADVIEHRNLGIAFYRTGMLEDATREFRRVVELRPDDAPARFHLALIVLREGRDREAVRRFKALLEVAGPSHAAFVDLAFALKRLGRAADALLVLDEAEALKPGTPAVALVRGAVLLQADRVADAATSLQEYRKRLGKKAKPAPAFYHYAALAAALAGRLDVAEATAREGLGEHSASPPLLLLAGAVAERKGELDVAEHHYRHAAEEDPNLVQAHKNLGDLAYRRGLHDEALEHYNHVIELASELGDDVYAKLGNLHYRLQRREEALSFWRRALELNPQNQVVRNNLEAISHARA